tara:strand:- start:155 stop:364 length:210 start_codon:yes stop_codon:yes gene_type:complete
MTKKHFIAIAKILNEDKANLSLILDLCRAFIDINPRFDKKKFIEASYHLTLENNGPALDSWVEAEEARL